MVGTFLLLYLHSCCSVLSCLQVFGLFAVDVCWLLHNKCTHVSCPSLCFFTAAVQWVSSEGTIQWSDAMWVSTGTGCWLWLLVRAVMKQRQVSKPDLAAVCTGLSKTVWQGPFKYTIHQEASLIAELLDWLLWSDNHSPRAWSWLWQSLAFTHVFQYSGWWPAKITLLVYS